jgi:hypothetical protein
MTFDTYISDENFRRLEFFPYPIIKKFKTGYIKISEVKIFFDSLGDSL